MAHNYENTTTKKDAPNPHAEGWQALAQDERGIGTEKQAREMAIQEVGSRLHDVWRAPRLREDGTYEPREKTTTDEAWIAEHGTNTVDIANTDFQDLPQDWKQENEDAARVLDMLVRREFGFGWELKDDEGNYTEAAHRMAARVHGMWLDRENNAWAKGGELDVPFHELTPGEQAKDLAQVELIYTLAYADEEVAYEINTDQLHAHYNKYGRLLWRTFRETGERY